MIAVEICASTIRDVAVAPEAGADRVELCSVWSVGGITPNVVVVEAAAAMGIPVRALIRPREGSFVHSSSERSWAVEEAKVMLDCGAERVVVGALNASGTLDEAYLDAMVEAVSGASRGTGRWTPAQTVLPTWSSCSPHVRVVRGLARAADGVAR